MLQQTYATFLVYFFNICVKKCKARALRLIADAVSTIEEGRAVTWKDHAWSAPAKGDDNKASGNKRSAAAAKCQAISLHDNGTETSHKSRVWLHSAGSRTPRHSPYRRPKGWIWALNQCALASWVYQEQAWLIVSNYNDLMFSSISFNMIASTARLHYKTLIIQSMLIRTCTFFNFMLG